VTEEGFSLSEGYPVRMHRTRERQQRVPGTPELPRAIFLLDCLGAAVTDPFERVFGWDQLVARALIFGGGLTPPATRGELDSLRHMTAEEIMLGPAGG
jgi:hypothetical protein